MREDLLDVLRDVSDEDFTRKPAKGRPLRQIVEHIFGAEYGYVRRFGKIPGVDGPGKVEAMARPELMDWMAYVRRREIERLRSFTDEELRAVARAGSQVKTARSYMRKMLSHQWEHLTEIRGRPGKPV
jgi:uncharacterized damage-inducible protein DinB